MSVRADRLVSWFIRLPPPRAQGVSLVLAVSASGIALFETARTLAAIARDEIVAVPRLDWWTAAPVSIIGALTVWAIGTGALASKKWRVRWGWMAPVGALASSALDRQTLGSAIGYLVVIATASHWFSCRLREYESTQRMWGAPLRVLQVQVSVVFAWTAFAKLNPRFMSGAVLSGAFAGPIPPPDFLVERRSLMALAVLTVVAESFFAIGLWMRTVRPLALVGVVTFHVLIVMFFQPTLTLIAFALVMGSGYALHSSGRWPPVGRPWDAG